ncbi:hypothetical protein C4K14_1430 [Pseudomonas chlororaphis subsp. aureofaciens]|uniref:hypothetical protein n=1 Tax=Pseudomonas chlororaphis TaxID=587753 RepID=UPI000F5887AF|nr:hypothetical protein [Pseudomonas chlororaphis]AZD84271.1 hypothetical protein C4K14_1430 [Pseudomonas chlororaphis subsp. aureofaciens]
MRQDIKQAIECWASRPTWFSSHPSDARELKQAVSKLKKLSPRPTENELTAAIYQRVKDLPAMLGTPRDIEKVAGEFAAKIWTKL